MNNKEIQKKKYLHPILFKSEQMEGMMVPILTNEAVSFYNSEGIPINRCATCQNWLELRCKYNMWGFVTCYPCVKK